MKTALRRKQPVETTGSAHLSCSGKTLYNFSRSQAVKTILETKKMRKIKTFVGSKHFNVKNVNCDNTSMLL